MKRMVSFLLAATLVMTPAMQVSAEPDISVITEEQGTQDGLLEVQPGSQIEESPAAGEEDQPESEAAETEQKSEAADTEGINVYSQSEELVIQSQATDIGQVHVSVGAAVILEKELTLTVELTGQESKTITLPSDKDEPGAKRMVSFEKLQEGTYTLKVTAPGFTDYTQDIEVKGRAYTVNLLTGFVKGYTYENGVPHPGVILLGDVEKDGIIDDMDRDKLTDAIDAGVFSAETDLNGDGITDLADLEYFADSYQENGDTQAFAEDSVSADAVTPKAGADTAVEGNLADILSGNGSVFLKPTSGEISEGHPVVLEFELLENTDTQADGILIKTSKENPVSKAIVDVTYMNADGTEGTVTVPVEENVQFLLTESEIHPEIDGNGNIQIHLGSQIAVKKVTLKIIGMKKNNNLAEISKVQFLNGMENRIPEPQMDIPQHLEVKEAGSLS